MNRRSFLQSIGAAAAALQFKKSEPLPRPTRVLLPILHGTNCAVFAVPEEMRRVRVSCIFDESKGFDITMIHDV